ncbi:PREDICTED: DNA-directed RNA polymerase I subunit RPA49-like [Acropora digitifera]|uniref:DNA-directed RNA polymerase I subunit RPA49-like n=1 Tax=Acropora digitifera TaxID=70779 RepID=UPI00077AE5FA|nr:PREDICTED: DNA-directed RNA polymerase I subunit RPA49-like [Acropora digitifera]
MATATLEYVPSDDTSSAKPFVVHFTNGNLNHSLNKKLNKKIKFAYYQWADHEDVRKKHRKTLIAETDEMDYVGQNFGEFSRSNTMCKYVLGVYNSNTKVMKMYDTEIVTLQPKVLVDASLNSVGLIFLQKTVWIEVNVHEPCNSFNTTQAVARESSAQALQRFTIPSITDGVTEQYSYIPPFNADATTAAEVYIFDEIITPIEFDILQKTSLEFQNSNSEKVKEWRAQHSFPEYILQHLEVMPVNPTRRLHQSCCLLYLSYMMKLYRLTYKDLKRKDPLIEVPDVIKNRLFSLFSIEKGKSRAIPKRLKDKLVSYILVLALILDDYSLVF